MLKTIDNHIHVEVRKLYPDAELPVFEYQQPDEDHLILTYNSPRGFADFALGLIEGCIQHFGDTVEIERKDLSDGAGQRVEFSMTLVHG
jgi:hypothetical protein